MTSDKIKADSLDKAIEVIKERIEALAKESGGSEKHAAQIKALKQALASSRRRRARSQSQGRCSPKVRKPRISTESISRGSSDAADPSSSPRRRPSSTRRRPASMLCRKELDEKRQQLQQAQQELAKLAGQRPRPVASRH